MYKEIKEINSRPTPFQFYTASELWANEHTSKQMLEYHLNESIDVHQSLIIVADDSKQHIQNKSDLLRIRRDSEKKKETPVLIHRDCGKITIIVDNIQVDSECFPVALHIIHRNVDKSLHNLWIFFLDGKAYPQSDFKENTL